MKTRLSLLTNGETYDESASRPATHAVLLGVALCFLFLFFWECGGEGGSTCNSKLKILAAQRKKKITHRGGQAVYMFVVKLI